jgi:nicotinate phosphoribosyltransferase
MSQSVVGQPTPALFTDMYELTMVEAARKRGTAGRHCVFEVFNRRLGPGRRYAVIAGMTRVLEEVVEFTFSAEQLEYLAKLGPLSPGTIDWLAGYRFNGDIDGYPEGEIFFPNSPILRVESDFATGVVLETLILSILNHDVAVASAASRIWAQSKGRPIIEMGSRRTHEQAAVAAARATYVAGFASTSNLAAGLRYGIPTAGTAAHAFTLLHDSEREAFAAQVAALGEGTTLLVDTYDVRTGIATALEVAGTKLGAIRLDSGDLAEQALAARAQLDEAGATATRIVATSDLDEYALAELAGAPIDGYGVGTSVVTGSGVPTAGLVFKSVEVDGRSVAKASAGEKSSVGGRKQAVRQIEDGVAVAELVGHDVAPRPGSADRALIVPLMREGTRVDDPDLQVARDRHRMALAQLPAAALALAPGEPVIPTVRA